MDDSEADKDSGEFTLRPLSKYQHHELPFKNTLQIFTSTSQSENRMYVQSVVKVYVF